MVDELTPRARSPLRIVATREDEANEDRCGLCEILVVEAFDCPVEEGWEARETD